MIISLQHFVPLPLRDLNSGLSDFWRKKHIEFESGKKYLLYASSGKGKTTLLSSLYGIRKDYDGDLLIDNENIRDYHWEKWSELRKNKFSYIFQGLELFDDLTAMENILLKNAQTNYKTTDEILNLASSIEMESFLDKKAGMLSYGQKQRVAIIRSLCQDFRFLLADEIFSHLDDEMTKKTFKIIVDECARRNAGLLFTSLSPNNELEFDHKFQL